MIDEKALKKIVVIGCIVLLLILTVVILQPILVSIVLGLLMSFMFYPLYTRVLRLVHEKNISALIIVILLLFVIFIPLWFLFPILVRQVFDVYSYSQKIDLFSPLNSILPNTISKDTFVLLNNFTSKILSSVFSSFTDTLLNLPSILLQLVVILFVFFFGMRDAEKMKDYIKKISPFSPELEHNLAKQFQDITNSVVYGHIIVGAIQGILTGIGLLIFQVPHALLLTLIAMLAAVIPILGAWLIWIPASVYLLVSGHTGLAIGLFLYGALFVSWIDNFLRPYIISRKTNINSGIILVGMIGGLTAFGVIGILLGPLILAYLLVILDAYKNKELAKFFN